MLVIATVCLAVASQRVYSELSGGQRQRVDVSRAIVYQARLIIRDVPDAMRRVCMTPAFR